MQFWTRAVFLNFLKKIHPLFWIKSFKILYFSTFSKNQGWENLRKPEKTWENLRKLEKTWEETWEKMRKHLFFNFLLRFSQVFSGFLSFSQLFSAFLSFSQVLAQVFSGFLSRGVLRKLKNKEFFRFSQVFSVFLSFSIF